MKSGEYETARLLLERGADVNAATASGFTALMCAADRSFGVEDRAASQSHVDLVQLLLQHGADLNRRSHAQSTALDYALVGSWGNRYGEDDTERPWSDVALLLAQAGAQQGEPRARWCYMAVPAPEGLLQEPPAPRNANREHTDIEAVPSSA